MQMVFRKKSLRRDRMRQADPDRFVQIAPQHIHFHEQLMPFARFIQGELFDLDLRRPDLLRLIRRLQLNV